MLPCLSRRAAAATPQLLSVAPLAAPFNSTLTLVGANLSGPASGGGGASAPTVSVCGGRACAVLAHNATHVQCRMPMCSADANETTLLHVPPYGYAQPLGDTAVRGVLSVTAAVLASGAAAQGSAAGGVTLQLTGEGFADDAARMRVSLRHGGAVLAACEVPASTTSAVSPPFPLHLPTIFPPSPHYLPTISAPSPHHLPSISSLTSSPPAHHLPTSISPPGACKQHEHRHARVSHAASGRPPRRGGPLVRRACRGAR